MSLLITSFISSILVVFLIILGCATTHHDLLLFVSSPLGMLAKFLLLDRVDWGLSSKQLSLSLLDSLSFNVALAPRLFFNWRRFLLVSGRSSSKERCVLLSLLLHDFLVLGLINLLGSLLVSLRHLLTHNLGKGARATRWVKPFFGLRFILRVFRFF